MSSGASDKSEKPTPRRLRDAERRGRVAVSRDLGSAAALASTASVLAFAGPALAAGLASEVRAAVGRAASAESLDAPAAQFELARWIWIFVGAAVPAALGAAAASALALALQTRGIASAEPLAPKAERFDPAAGLKRLASPKALVELVKTAAKLAAAGAAAWTAVSGNAAGFLDTESPDGALFAALAAGRDAALRASGALLLLAAADVLVQRWLHERDLRMSKDDVRRDMKEDEGDPHVRQERRRLHAELSAGGLHAVRRASVVVANPTHVAAALRYGRDGHAPRVVAKGVDGLALRIRREAEIAGVPVVEDRTLARALARVELDAEIPEALYAAVAEVLLALADMDAQAAAPRREAT